MIHVNFKYILFFAIFLLTSCATIPPRHALNDDDKRNIHSNNILLNSNQHEIVMRHNNWFDSDLPDPHLPMPSGPIVPQAGITSFPPTVLIVKGIQSHLGSIAISPIRSTIKDFDFLKTFNVEIQNTVAKLPWLKVKKQVIKYDLKSKESEIVADANENTTLFIGTTYALNSNFKKLEVAAYVKLAEKSNNNREPHTLYTNNMYFIYRLPEPNKNTKENKKYWINNNGEQLKEKLHDAASLLANMIKVDIGNSHSNIYQSNNKLIAFRNINGSKTEGHLIKQQNGYYIISSNDNEIYVVNEHDLIVS